MVWAYKHVIGDLVFDTNYRVVAGPKPGLSQSTKNAKVPSPTDEQRMRSVLRDAKYRKYLILGNKTQTLADLQIPIGDDEVALHLAKTLHDMKNHYNQLGSRLREWVGEMAPEVHATIIEPAKLAALVVSHNPETFYESIGASRKTSPGGSFTPTQYKLLKTFCDAVIVHQHSIETLDQELRVIVTRIMPNCTEIMGVHIAVKLLEHAGGLKKLSLMPAAKIQLLGAEEALFKHIKDPKRFDPPKHGVIFDHQLIQHAQKKDRGRVARALADKAAIALRVDYFKGQPIGKKLMKQLEARFA